MASWFYGPDGQSGVFDTCPEGWADHPCKCESKAEPVDVVAAVQKLVDGVSAFDHDGDGKPGGSLPKAKRKPRKAVSDGNRN